MNQRVYLNENWLYSSDYFDELKATSEILEEILGTTDFTRDEIIYYEWW